MYVILVPLIALAAVTVNNAATAELSFSPSDSSRTVIMNWNLENFFDWKDGGYSDSDREFSSSGARHWTKKKFMAKADAIAKAILWTAGRFGQLPDLIALEEVENRFVLKMLLEETILRKKDYGIVHFDSPDTRGIDVALLYRKSVFNLADARPLAVGDTAVFRTRDILLARMERKPDGKTFAILVNHHPSKFGGGQSDWKREAAVARLKAAADSLHGLGEHIVVAAGDFNDTPENPVLGRISGVFEQCGDSLLVNLAIPLSRQGGGTIRFNGKWELIDMFLLSPAAARLNPEMTILKIPFLMQRDNTHIGDKPLRTYIGPRYNGGVSDHLPIVLTLDL